MLKTITKLLLTTITLLFASSALADQYVLSAGDTIKISVYGEDDLSIAELIIDSRETFDYPYLGNISTQYKTLEMIQNEIEDGLRGDYLIDPKVNVSIVKYRNIYVNGVVNRPGAYEFQPDLTVDKAIALAGGFLAKYRKTKGIYLTRNDEVKGLSQSEINNLLKNKEPVDRTASVEPGDTIYVVSSFW
ncbi:polysaccharide export protein [Vibrio sp. JC009]|uniref:polysaccharide biosynthesis/export family protein n=1 Tax=Vibrio sp. JC009 TaxID=2912314 RepID=UPI0023B195AE|nr:polysaccharide biosynthesis/export family protein [Vibrio sp. JC009]WED20647.1 polysaccharide export protein [Vibrio sp. JC009]